MFRPAEPDLYSCLRARVNFETASGEPLGIFCCRGWQPDAIMDAFLFDAPFF